jgi:hypothetical protein
VDLVLISRCAWHHRYYGHSKLLGVSNWRGLRIDLTDGICPKCAARVRAVRQHRGVRRPPQGTDRTSEILVVALAVLTGLVLIARPANEGSVPVEVAGLLPSAVTMVQAVPASARASLPARARRPPAAPVSVRPAELLQSP